jgi:cytochrome c oxidase subunit 2
LYGQSVQLADGSTTVADDRYLRDAILLPHLHPVAGYPAVMPSFSGQISEEDMLALLAYIKSGARATS